MALVRNPQAWNPFEELRQMSNRLGSFFGNNDEIFSLSTGWMPTTNVSENDKEYRISVELPAVNKQDVHVSVQNGVLSIEGERKQEKEEKSEHYHRRESYYGHFLRRFTLPEDADAGKVDASFNNGMLEVHVIKSAAKAQPKAHEIAIK